MPRGPRIKNLDRSWNAFRADEAAERFLWAMDCGKIPLNDTSSLAAVTDPGDSPASPDALRDDLVANTIPSIETALVAPIGKDDYMGYVYPSTHAPTVAVSTHGCSFTTNTNANDECIIRPTNQTGATSLLRSTAYTAAVPLGTRAIVKLPAITSLEVAMGFRHPDDSSDVLDEIASTNNYDQVAIWFNPATSANWQCTIVRDGAATTIDSKIPVVAAAVYDLYCEVDSNQYVSFWINGVFVGKTSVAYRLLKDNGSTPVQCVPYIYVKTTTTAAKTIRVRAFSGWREWTDG